MTQDDDRGESTPAGASPIGPGSPTPAVGRHAYVVPFDDDNADELDIPRAPDSPRVTPDPAPATRSADEPSPARHAPAAPDAGPVGDATAAVPVPPAAQVPTAVTSPGAADGATAVIPAVRGDATPDRSERDEIAAALRAEQRPPAPTPVTEPEPEPVLLTHPDPSVPVWGGDRPGVAGAPAGSLIGASAASSAAPFAAPSAEPVGGVGPSGIAASTAAETSMLRAPGRGDGGRAARRRAAAAATGDAAADTPGFGPAPRDGVRLLARGVGQTLITLGVVVLLFVVYELWITDIFSARKQQDSQTALERSWGSAGASAPASTATAAATAAGGASAASASAAGGTVVTGTAVVTVQAGARLVAADPGKRQVSYSALPGQAFAELYIPAFGPDYKYTVTEGTSDSDLDVGPGHYTGTQLPGQAGNFAIAGHRVSKGSPFNELGLLNSCDALVVETKDDWYVYRVLPMQTEVTGWTTSGRAHCDNVAAGSGEYAEVFGREITDPSDYAQVAPVPHRSGSQADPTLQRLITLTTCHPQFSDAQRMIVHGVLVKDYPKTPGLVPPELSETD